jgi:hypothetical protein
MLDSQAYMCTDGVVISIVTLVTSANWCVHLHVDLWRHTSRVSLAFLQRIGLQQFFPTL